MTTVVAPRGVDRVVTPAPVLTALATLSAAAGVVHLVMVPAHMQVSAVEGIAFAVAGWLQLLLAFSLWTQPSRPVLGLAAVVNLAFIGFWALTRTVGLPTDVWSTTEPASLVDVATVGIEAALVLLAGAVLLRPSLAEIELPPALAVAVPLAVVVLTSAVLASPEARAHTHGAGGGTEAAVGGHAHGGAAGAGESAAVADDRGLSLLTNGHHHEIVEQAMSPATTLELKRQLTITRAVAERLPTVATAEAAGYRRAGPFSPGLGAHYTITSAAALNMDGVMTDEELRNPLSIIYDGTEPDSPVAGFMYYATTPAEPEGFAGQNDVWHYHTSTCLTMTDGEINAPFGADLEVTDAQCSQVGGFMLDQTQYMVHVWSVPGYNDVPGGVFAEVNPALDCADGTYWRLPQSAWPDHLMNVCEAGAA